MLQHYGHSLLEIHPAVHHLHNQTLSVLNSSMYKTSTILIEQKINLEKYFSDFIFFPSLVTWRTLIFVF
jgi:hypothetical protein